MNCGADFATVIAAGIDDAERRREHNSVRFWQDVFASDFDSHQEKPQQTGGDDLQA
jgi:hypothetical protein